MLVDPRRIEGFLMELDDQNQAKAMALLGILEGSKLPYLPAPHGEKVEKDLFALRLRTKANIRLYYTVTNGKAVMLCGIYKGQQRIPLRTLRHCRQSITLIRAGGA